MGKQNIVFINLICVQLIPDSCCAPTCSTKRIPVSSLSVHNITSGDPEKKKDSRVKWLNTIYRDKWSEEKICIVQPINQPIDFLNNNYTGLKQTKNIDTPIKAMT